MKVDLSFEMQLETSVDQPLVSCIMPTRDRRQFIPRAIDYFQRQDYANRELVVVDDGADSVEDLMPNDMRIRYYRLNYRTALGFKRNLACERSLGSVIAHWDDDDWMADSRLTRQVEGLLREHAQVCGVDRLFFYEPECDLTWEYAYSGGRRWWVAGGTLCYTKGLWALNPFPGINQGEDTLFLQRAFPAKIAVLPDHSFYVAIIHPGNTCPKRRRPPMWRAANAEIVRSIMGLDGYQLISRGED